MFLLSLPQCGLLKMTERYKKYLDALDVAKKHGNRIFEAAINKELRLMKERGEDVKATEEGKDD